MKKFITLATIAACSLLFMGANGCTQPIESVSGTKMATIQPVKTGPSGLTVEQDAIQHRIKMDNSPGAIKHLYVFSAYSGQAIIYSTVVGKVTSSGKRLTPDRINTVDGGGYDLPGSIFSTDQVLGEDGTYGSSIEYLYWWDAKGVYHQHYVQGGQILHISDQPMPIRSVMVNMSLEGKVDITNDSK